MNVNKVISGEVNRISMVDNPANGESICGDVFCAIDGDYVTTTVLKADQIIYRGAVEDKEEYFFYIEESVVNDLAHTFLERNMNSNLSIDHSPFLDDGIKLAESWVEDGVWRLKLRIDDEEIMARVHDGTIKGASIEAINIMETVLSITDDVDKFEADAAALDSNTKRILFGEYNI